MHPRICGLRAALGAAALIVAGGPAVAEEMTVYSWDPGCNHTTSTSWFTLAAGESSQKIYIDLSECTDEQRGNLLFFGNYATKTSGRQLERRHKIRLSMTPLDRYGNVADQMATDDGFLLADVANYGSKGVWLIAQNTNRNKDAKISLRAQLVAP